MPQACIGIGSNLGDRAAYIALAESMLRDAAGVADLRCSSVYETEPVGPIDQGPFLNAAATCETALSPQDLLKLLRQIEAKAGRLDAEDREHWGPRELDLDLLLYGDQQIDQPNLKVPHPRMHERWFVLKPLAEVAGDAVHPSLQKTINQLLTDIEQAEEADAR